MAKRGVRKFTEWLYTEKEAHLKIKVEVNDRSISHDAVPDGEPDIVFQVRIAEPPITLSDPDLNKLKERLWAALKGQLHVKWQPYLYITFAGHADSVGLDSSDRFAKGTAIEMTISLFELAEMADGQKFRRSKSAYDTEIHAGWPDTGPTTIGNYYTKDLMRVLIPDTKENRKTFNKLVDGFNTLIENMNKFLSPEQIETSLQQLQLFGNRPALPGPILPKGKAQQLLQP
jgi:hypothetical protein